MRRTVSQHKNLISVVTRASHNLLALRLLALLLASPALIQAQPTAGNLDLTFGSSGKLITDFGAVDKAQDVAIQVDGKIVVAGFNSYNGGNNAVALARYNADGSLDHTFGSGGKVLSDLGLSAETYAVGLQPDGKIVVAGRVFGGNDTYFDWFIARYNPDGSLDTAFGSGGKTITDFGSFDAAHDLAIQSDGKIAVAGEGDQVFAVARYEPNGNPDATFGTGGKVDINDFGRISVATSIRIQKNGRMIVAGYSLNSTPAESIILARYQSNGSLDTSFGVGGRVITNISTCRGLPDDAAGHDLALQADGKIILAGYTYNACGGTEADFAVARYNPDGSPDTTFGSSGKATTDFTEGPGGAYSVAIQNDGKIVVGGTILHYFVGHEFALARYNADGSPDLTFGSGGKITTWFGTLYDEAFAIAMQLDSKIIAVGHRSGDFALARYESGIVIPKITGTSVSGKKLYVVGDNFDSGAKVLINGQQQKTANDPENPSTRLIAKKAGKKIKPGDRLRVQNADGTLSSESTFTGQVE